jgi:hypothetical protein
MNGYTGARWSELVVLRAHDYDEINHAIPVRTPLRGPDSFDQVRVAQTMVGGEVVHSI